MRRTVFSVSTIAAVLFQLCLSNGFAAHQQRTTDSIIGVVVEIDKNTMSAIIKTDGGAVLTLKTDEQTACLRIPAGEKTLANATPIQFADIAKGDRILSHGKKTDQEFLAQRLVVLPKVEIEKKRARDLNEWRRRGIGGIVRSLNRQTGEIDLELRGANAGGHVVIVPAQANFRRYTPGSLRFEDAAASAFADIRVGDQLRALGDISADGRSFKAEEIVSGAFKTIGVTVVKVNPQTGEIHATTLDQKKPVTISFIKDSVLHRISASVAAAIAQKAKADAAKPAGTQPGQKPSQPVIDVQQMIDTLPATTLADIKSGDVLAVTGAVENDDGHLVAIKVAAGVDLVLKALAPASGKPQTVRLSAGLPPGFDFSVIPVN